MRPNPLAVLVLTFWVAVLAAGPAAAGEEAEKLFRGMEAKIRAAEALGLKYDLDVTDARGKRWAVTGSVVLGEGDRLRVEADGKLFGKKVRFTLVSDGKSLRSAGLRERPKIAKPEPPPSGVGPYFRESLARYGFLETLLHLELRDDPAPEVRRVWNPSDFTIADKERVGGREAHVVSHRLPARFDGEGAERVSVAVWIDAQTGLPLKRTVAGGTSDIAALTETYTQLTLAPDIDAKSFDLP